MAREVLGNRSAHTRLASSLLALAATLSGLRLLHGLRSWQDAVTVLLSAVLAGLLLWLLARALGRSQSRRARALRQDLHAAHVWPVVTKWSTYYLVASDTAISLVDRRARPRGTWPLGQIRKIAVERVPIGTPSRTGMRIELGVHAGHETLEFAFPRWGGLWSSTSEAQSAKETLNAMRNHPHN